MERQMPSDKDIEAHFTHLVKKVFNPGGDMPQFEQMLDSIRAFAAETLSNENVLVLERAYIYGGTCFFAPLFASSNVVAVDCQLGSTPDRFGFNRHFAESSDVIRWPADHASSICALPVSDSAFERIVIPNVVHHVKDQASMFAEWARVLKPGGKGFLFEALVRELHQVPDDYLRYTPYGMKSALEAAGLEVEKWSPTTDIYDVIRYCFLQAFPYFPESERKETEIWVRENVFPRLTNWTEKFKVHLKNSAKTFPTGFLMTFVKPSGASDVL